MQPQAVLWPNAHALITGAGGGIGAATALRSKLGMERCSRMCSKR
jgi:hypothetical protein